MPNVNATAAISEPDAVGAALISSRVPGAPANKARRPLALVTGRDVAGPVPASAAATEAPRPASGTRVGIFAMVLTAVSTAIEAMAATRKARAEARDRRIAEHELAGLSDFVLRDIGFTRDRSDDARLMAALHRPRV